MYTRRIGGILIASSDASETSTAWPCRFTAPVPVITARLVPAWRVTFVNRPGSIVKVTVDGATPVETCAVSADETVVTAYVSFPAPMLLTLTAACARPGLQGFVVRNTCVESTDRIGCLNNVESGR